MFQVVSRFQLKMQLLMTSEVSKVFNPFIWQASLVLLLRFYLSYLKQFVPVFIDW